MPQRPAESANRPSSDEAERWKMKYELEKEKVSTVLCNMQDSPNTLNISFYHIQNQLLKETSSREFDRVTSEIREKFHS